MPLTTDQEAVLRVLQEVFDAMEARDHAAMHARMTEQGWATQSRDGRIFAERLWDIGGRFPEGGKRVTERMREPLVRVDDDIAMVWCAYDLYWDDELHHSGSNIVSFIKTEGCWLICGITSNGRTPRRPE